MMMMMMMRWRWWKSVLYLYVYMSQEVRFCVVLSAILSPERVINSYRCKTRMGDTKKYYIMLLYYYRPSNCSPRYDGAAITAEMFSWKYYFLLSFSIRSRWTVNEFSKTKMFEMYSTTTVAHGSHTARVFTGYTGASYWSVHFRRHFLSENNG